MERKREIESKSRSLISYTRSWRKHNGRFDGVRKRARRDVEALNETREVHVGDVQQQLRTIQHRVPPPLNFSLPQIVHHEITEHRFRSFHRFLSRCCAAIFTSWASFQRPTKILDTIFPFLLTPLRQLAALAYPKT